MKGARDVIEAAFASAADQAETVGAEYAQKLDDFRAHGIAVLDDLAAGIVTPEQALQAAEQEANAVKSLLLAGAYDANKVAANAALSVIAAVLKAALVAMV